MVLSETFHEFQVISSKFLRKNAICDILQEEHSLLTGLQKVLQWLSM